MLRLHHKRITIYNTWNHNSSTVMINQQEIDYIIIKQFKQTVNHRLSVKLG